MKNEQKPKRKKPDFTGVPGEIVALDGLELNFSKKLGRISPYDKLLDDLCAAGPESALKFADPRARVSIAQRAKKKELVLAFAEAGGVLYVKVVGRVGQDQAVKRKKAIERILKVKGPMKFIQLAARMREDGDTLIQAPEVELYLYQMQRDGLTIFTASTGCWALNERAEKRP